MTDFVSTWNEESFLTTPVAPLGLIAMRGTEDMGDKVNKWLLKWRKYTEETLPGDMSTTPGMGREDFLVRATCPRFGNGEGKGLIKDSVRGLDLYILCDVGAYKFPPPTATSRTTSTLRTLICLILFMTGLVK